jgi:hypothetical protein
MAASPVAGVPNGIEQLNDCYATHYRPKKASAAMMKSTPDAAEVRKPGHFPIHI